jgi:Domain of unknown function (DUF4918)
LLLSKKLISFYLHLQPPRHLPAGIEVLFPQHEAEVKKIIGQFFNRYYNDQKSRRLIFGINPGRFGAGITGINFTAPKQLADNCGIKHAYTISSELSAEFIYEMIEAYGGVKKFYSHFFLAAISPLGFVKNGKNINYYDDKDLLEAIKPFAIDTINKQLAFGFTTDCCYCIGEDKNYKFLSMLNQQHQWFDTIIPLPHPRFIMQYRRKEKEKYVRQYIEALTNQA